MDFIFNVLKKFEIENKSNHEQEGIVLAILMTVYVDHKIKSEEQDKLEAILKKIEWHSHLSIDHFLASNADKIHRAVESNDFTEIINMIDEKVTTKEGRKQAVELCRAIAMADHEFHEAEKSFIRQLQDDLNVIG